MSEIGWHSDGYFVNPSGCPIGAMFKLYPWEWMVREAFGVYLPASHVIWIEPAWKMVLSNKGILPVLWKLFPSSLYLVEARWDEPAIETGWVKKPLLGREGSNITMFAAEPHTVTDGPYGAEGWVWQRIVDGARFDGMHPVIGSWIIGNEAHGMGFENPPDRLQTTRASFVPHLFR